MVVVTIDAEEARVVAGPAVLRARVDGAPATSISSFSPSNAAVGASVTINGVNATNLYLASGSYPAKINGYWYVSYNSTVSYGHFEAK